MPKLNIITATALALTALATVAPPTLAKDGSRDSIVLELATEGWVETETAEVVVSVNATMRQEQAANVRASIMEALGRLSGDADWRITNFNRNADRSGLDSWFVQAQARIADTQLDGIRQAAEDASEPGMQISISGISFTPTLAEVEATRASLRSDLYKSARAEMDRVNEAFPESPYHIGVINFTSQPIAPMMMREERAYARTAGAMDAAQSDISVEDRIRLQATVVLATDDDDEAQ